MFGRMFGARRQPREAAKTPRVPAGRRIYAIGDIHGRADLLRTLHASIVADASAAPDLEPVVVYLGDYVDRGLDSRAVIDILLDAPLPGFEVVQLLGNHEAMMLNVLESGEDAFMWLHNGGNATVYSYGIPVPAGMRSEAEMEAIADRLREAVPAAHMTFLHQLRHSHVEGDYLFVHAGVRPGLPLEQQDPGDLIWIRDAFLDADIDFGKVVVHGHSISGQVDERANRIGIDTGAYASGCLTCLVLEGEQRRYLQT